MVIIQPYRGQIYETLKQECLSKGALFTDPLFQPKKSSIRKLSGDRENIGNTLLSEIEWLRPHEIVNKPQFIVNGIDPNDLVQGDVGDCWFISAASSLLTIPKLAQFVIPFDQSFTHYYCGLFHFRFWQFGQWVDVVIDDYLPVNSETRELLFCHNSKDTNEMFGPLMEKAYAKLAGCYDFLDGGDPNNAHVDFTGTVCETFDIRKCVELSTNKDDNEGDNENEDNTEDGYEDDENYDEDYEGYEEESGYNATDVESLWIFILKSYKANSLMNASYYADEEEEEGEDGDDAEDEDDGEDEGDAQDEEEDENEESENEQDDGGDSETGLWPGHAYSVIQAIDLRLNKKRVRLIKLRDPNAGLNAYKGDWNINSNKWKRLDLSIKSKYNLKLNPNGEFYITFEDFITYFHDLNVTHLDLNHFFDSDKGFEQLIQDSISSKWKYIQFYGQWLLNVSSNTQYLIQILDESHKNSRKKDYEFDRSVLISLMQPYTEQMRVRNNGEYGFELIKFDVYAVDDRHVKTNLKNGKKFAIDNLEEVDSSGEFGDREVTKRFNLEPGYYVIVPSLSDETVKMKYLLRFFFNDSYFKFEKELN